MNQQLHLLTLGVKDLGAMKRFYTEKFGWTTLIDRDGIVFIKLNGIILALFPEHELAEDAGVKNDGKGFKRFTLAVCLKSEKEVDEKFSLLRSRGVKVVKEPEKVFWGGYRGYVSDPEHNLWEIAYNPFLKFDRDGNIAGHA